MIIMEEIAGKKSNKRPRRMMDYKLRCMDCGAKFTHWRKGKGPTKKYCDDCVQKRQLKRQNMMYQLKKRSGK